MRLRVSVTCLAGSCILMHVLCVGGATLDIVNRVVSYPTEDSEVRATEQSRRMGGNAANTAIVLAQLGARVRWAGSLAPDAQVVDATFARFGVDAAPAMRCAAGAMPTSYVTLSAANGTRSIVHYRDLPEYPAAAFQALDLGVYDWVHFEGRAVDQLLRMLRHVRSTYGLPVSLEVEKPRAGIEALFEQVDLLLFSRDYATAVGCVDAAALLRAHVPPGVPATCTWGDAGACAVDADGQLLRAPAPQLEKVVDTLGAGDVFNAAMVFGMANGRRIAQVLPGAVALASAQCARAGLTLSAGPDNGRR